MSEQPWPPAPPASNAARSIAIGRWIDMPDRGRLLPGMDQVFFASSATQSFASDEVRSAFRQRWLGRYLEHFPQWTYVALTPDNAVVGYIVGSLDDPAKTPMFADLAYFQDFAAQTLEYPAQLHVNVAPHWRGLRIGARLVQTFCAALAQSGVAGVHVVTGKGMRNISYYGANGFTEVGATDWNGRELVMLGRRLEKPD